MAKIRTIKPEFWESEQVGECHPMARLLFICLLNFCDDGGNYPASVKAMKRNAFGYDEVTYSQVAPHCHYHSYVVQNHYFAILTLYSQFLHSA